MRMPISSPILSRRTEPSNPIRELALDLTRGLAEPEERAVAVFRFVRDEILYGFTPVFDAATPEETLRQGRGHCNPKSMLFVTMLGALGIHARSHFVTIDGRILNGIFPIWGPSRLSHAYTEVRLGGRWLSVDAYCVDRQLYRAGRRRLAQTEQRLGFGVHVDGVYGWDGTSSAMAQLAEPSMVLEDGGSFDDPHDFYRGARYQNRMSSVEARLYRWFGVEEGNRRLDALRREAWSSPRDEGRVPHGRGRVRHPGA